MKKCSSCGKGVMKDYVEFACPNCGKITMIRCNSCRTLGVKYTCSACEFSGP